MGLEYQRKKMVKFKNGIKKLRRKKDIGPRAQTLKIKLILE